ncbi:hypothetical protein N431DRAFT_450742 [Stipitochalara longipes BDJ]|nr:hypothetical protein N431DRAFT_450742 [Stipitochalara longipes BDJ]
MSFGFSIGDIIAVTNLAWKLHQDCYKVLQDCPQEIKDLSRDLATVYGVLRHIQEDLDSSGSSIKAHGEGRAKLLRTMVANLDKTLKNLQQLVSNFQHLALDSRKRDQFLSKLKYLVSQKKISKIHQEISFHISSFNLILASIGNSSLQRIESGMQQMRLSAQAHEDAPETLDDESQHPNDRNLSPIESSTAEIELHHEAEADAAIGSSNLASSQPGPEPQIPSRLNAQPLGVGDVARRLAVLSRSQQEEIIEIILENCQASCFGFYSLNRLWRTKFSSKDAAHDPKLFDRDDHRSATRYTDFSLMEWIAKIRHALGTRANTDDSCTWGSVYLIGPVTSFYDIMKKADRIPSMKIPWGGLDVDYCEEAVNAGIDLCEMLKFWDSHARLKRLLVQIRHSSGDIDLAHLRPELKSLEVVLESPEGLQSNKRSVERLDSNKKRVRR